MEKLGITIALLCMALTTPSFAQGPAASDTIKTSSGDLTLTFIGHGSLMFTFGGKVIHVDPYSKVADYGSLPKADIILITHEHGDHLDAEALAKVRTGRTVLVVNEAGATKLGSGTVMRNGEAGTVGGFLIEAVPAYNIVSKRENGQPYHPKGSGNGYVITFGDKRVYVAGDTENIPEMSMLKAIDIAFLPMNLPYTMTPEMVADAANLFQPKVLYPYHTGETDIAKLTGLMKDRKGIEVRIRSMK